MSRRGSLFVAWTSIFSWFRDRTLSQVFTELLAAGRKTLSRVLVLIVSMGFGVVKFVSFKLIGDNSVKSLANIFNSLLMQTATGTCMETNCRTCHCILVFRVHFWYFAFFQHCLIVFHSTHSSTLRRLFSDEQHLWPSIGADDSYSVVGHWQCHYLVDFFVHFQHRKGAQYSVRLYIHLRATLC